MCPSPTHLFIYPSPPVLTTPFSLPTTIRCCVPLTPSPQYTPFFTLHQMFCSVTGSINPPLSSVVVASSSPLSGSKHYWCLVSCSHMSPVSHYISQVVVVKWLTHLPTSTHHALTIYTLPRTGEILLCDQFYRMCFTLCHKTFIL